MQNDDDPAVMVDCPKCRGTGEGRKDHPGCPDCQCYDDCPVCNGCGEVKREEPNG